MKLFLVSLLATAFLGAVVSSPARRIVGGQFAENEKQFPYQVALFLDGEFKCGGSIIAEKWILTAAHCISDYRPEWGIIPIDELTIHVGSPHLHEGGKTVKPAKIIPHDDYPKIKYDIGLIELEEALVFDDAIKKIELYRGQLPVNGTVTISGHGKTGNDEPISEMLKHNTMTVLNNDACFNEIQHSGWKKILCVNNAPENGICTGDSGSAAVYEGKQIGVANFVLGKCAGVRPDGFAYVPHFVDWIEKTMKQ